MKRLTFAAPLFLCLFAPEAKAQIIHWRMKCEWRQVRPEVEHDIAYANDLLRLRCDAQLAAAMGYRFAQLDQDSLALYNRGIVSPATRPYPVAAGPR
jgi:hypothetical protein